MHTSHYLVYRQANDLQIFNIFVYIQSGLPVDSSSVQSKKIHVSNDQEQSDPISCAQNQKGHN